MQPVMLPKMKRITTAKTTAYMESTTATEFRSSTVLPRVESLNIASKILAMNGDIEAKIAGESIDLSNMSYSKNCSGNIIIAS